MAWITGADLLTYAASVLKVDEADLPALWTTISGLAANQGYADIVAVMANKGYPVSVIDTWDEGESLNYTQGLYRLGSLGGGYGDYKADWFKQFDLCDKDGILERAGVIVADGVAVASGGSAVGGIRYGRTQTGCTANRNWVRMGQGLGPLTDSSCDTTGCGCDD